MSGPTTTGSIDAKLTIDKSAWDRSVAEAKAEARELGALSPMVRVDANVGPAVAKMAELEAVERGLEATNVRLAVAEKALNQEQVHSTSSALRLATVEKMLGEAHKETAGQAVKQAVAEQAGAQATDKGTQATDRAVQANRQRVSGLQVLIAMSPALLAAAAPVAASAVGLGVAFGVMGLSGVLALKGIKDEMASGSQAGAQYSTGLGVLNGDLDRLAGTSANAMLGAFSTTVGDLNARMPFLTRMTGEASGALGRMGGTALSGVLSGLQQMNPLLQDGEIELGKFVTWLFSFNGTNGFSSFIGYAMDNLPGVMHLIENLVTTAGHILAAFAPLGPVVIGTLSGISDVLNNLPLPVLAGLVTTATLLGPALRLAFSESIAAMIGKVAVSIGLTGVMANLAVPVVGILTAAIAGIGIAAATSAIGTDQGTRAVHDYTQALKDDNQAIGENVRAVAAKALSDSGAAEAAKRHGISMTDLLDASLGVPDAMDRVRAANERVGASVTGVAGHATEAAQQNRKDYDLLKSSLGSAGSEISATVEKQKQLNEMMAPTTGAIDAQTQAAQAQAGQYGVTVGMYQAATTAQQTTAAQLAQTTLNMQFQNDAAGLLKQSFDALNGKSLSLEQAQTRAAGATNSVTKSFQQNGLAITGTTDAAVANQQALQNKVAADQAAAEAVAKATGSTEEGTKAYALSKEQLERNMAAQGLLNEDTQNYINKLYDVNNFKPKPTKLEIDKAKAEADLAAYKAMVEAATARRTQYIDIITNRIEKSTQDPKGTGSSIGGRENGSLAGGAETGGLIHAGFSASSPAYLSEGGSPFVPRGTDIIPAMLTPGEIVMKRASVNSLGAGNLLEANRTGQWPGQGGKGSQPVTVNLILDGRIIDSRIVDIASGAADQRIAAADSRSQYLRKGR